MPKQNLLQEDLPAVPPLDHNEGSTVKDMLARLDNRVNAIENYELDSYKGDIEEFEFPDENSIKKMSYDQMLGVLDNYERHHHRHHMHHREAMGAMPRGHRRMHAMLDRARGLGTAASWKEVVSMGIGSAISAPVLNWAASNNPLPNQDPNWPFYADIIILVISMVGAVGLRKYKHARLGFMGSGVYCVGALIDMAMQLGSKQNVGAISGAALGL